MAIDANKVIECAHEALRCALREFENLTPEEKFRAWEMVESVANLHATRLYEPEFAQNKAQELFMGCRQAVRQRALTPSSGGSIPSAPANIE